MLLITSLLIPIQGQPTEHKPQLQAINVAHLVPIAERPDYDQQVLIPLREAQREAAEKARVAAEEAARQAEARHIAALAAARQKRAVAPPVQVSGTHQDWMIAAGIEPGSFGYVEFIIAHESGWRWWAVNNEGSGATGLGQALPASKMAPFGADYLTNPITQLRWAQSYAVARYGGWAGAYAFWVAHRWW